MLEIANCISSKFQAKEWQCSIKSSYVTVRSQFKMTNHSAYYYFDKSRHQDTFFISQRSLSLS